ncbi:hypothetical protein NOCA2240068 [metagenome]|uniref:Peptidase C14 caspase domain-containing protein n=1 Tax=metagenome TaxID=256318 RepID=A0A2P2BZY4_9ZZZZ
MAGTRSALIVATYLHEDPGLTRLRAPARDAEELAEVLSDPEIGGFDVVTVVNGRCHEVTRAVAEFFKGRSGDDLLLLHFSGHGLKDDSGELYFAATDTSLDLLEATAVASSFVSRTMDRSRAGRVVLLLDCCYSGAFARGMVPRAVGTVDVNERLGGRGRAVITASSALQFAFEGDDLADSALDADGPSAFTSVLVRGLRTGEADRDLDGWVSLDELYAFVHDEVTRISPQQTPKKWAFDIEGDVYLARRGAPVSTPSDLPAEIERSLQSLLTWERASAAEPLSELLAGDHPGLAFAARLALERMAAEDDSARVRAAARSALGEPAVEEPVVKDPVVEDPVVEEPVVEEPVVEEPVVQEPVVQEPVVEEPVVEQRVVEEPAAPQPVMRGRRRVVTLSALAAAVLAGALVWVLRPDGGDDGGSGALVFPDNELLVTLDQPDGTRQLLAVDVTPGGEDPRVLSSNPDYGVPTLSPDRTLLTLQVGKPGTARPPYLASPDLSDVHELLDSSGRAACPFTTRPAWSPDSSELALLCTDEDKQVNGLRIVSLGGELVRELTLPCSADGPPSWGSDGRIYLECRDSGPDGSSTIQWVAADGSGESGELMDSHDGSERFPSWVQRDGGGVLFLRTDSPDDDYGSVWSVASDGEVDQLEQLPDLVGWPSKSPDEQSLAWLEPTDDGLSRLMVQLPDDSGPRAVGVEGSVGPPSWTSH